MSLIKNIKFDKEVLVIAGGGEKGIIFMLVL